MTTKMFKRPFGHDMHKCDAPWSDNAPPWAIELAHMQFITMIQNETILARLEDRASKLSPEDQALVNELFVIEQRDQKQLDAALAKEKSSAPGGSRYIPKEK